MIEEYKQNDFKLNRFIGILLVVVIIWLVSSIFLNSDNNIDEQLFIIESGESVDSITNRLKVDGYIDSSLAFKSYLQVTDRSSQLKAGEHYLSSAMSISEIVDRLVTAASQRDEQITLIEGWTNAQVGEYLRDTNQIAINDFLAAANKDYPTFDWLPRITLRDHLQGYLFPDTYRILPGSSSEDIIIKLLETFETKVYKPLEKDIAKHSMTLHELLTLASIVEMEVSSKSDRALVADIFLRRLGDNYPLQSDATVNYITQSGRAQSTIKDTKIDSPYNTYKYAGLPPGPIGNPSLSSIEAVLNPIPNTYYFFLTTKDDGRVMYSRTYDEHLDNKAKYLD